MQFMITYSFRPDARNAAQDRFKKTGGGPGPGAQMLGRWHAVGGHHGYVLAETTDSVALGKWMQEWTDLRGVAGVRTERVGNHELQRGPPRVRSALSRPRILPQGQERGDSRKETGEGRETNRLPGRGWATRRPLETADTSDRHANGGGDARMFERCLAAHSRVVTSSDT